MAWTDLYGALSSNKDLQKKSEKWMLGIKTEDLIPAALCLVLAARAYFDHKIFIFIPVNSMTYIYMFILGCILMALGFAYLNFTDRIKLWSTFAATPEELNLFSPEYSYFLPISKIQNNAIYTQGSFFKGPAVIGGMKVMGQQNFTDLSQGEQNLMVHTFQRLALSLTPETPFLVSIKSKNLDLSEHIEYNDKLVRAMSDLTGLKYYIFFQNKNLKFKQRSLKTKNQEAFFFFEIFQKYHTWYEEAYAYLKGEKLESYKDEKTRIRSLNELISIYSNLFGAIGYKVETMTTNDLREYFQDQNNNSKNFTFDRNFSLPNNYFEYLEDKK